MQSQYKNFIQARNKDVSIQELCEQFNISKSTGGVLNLQNKSRKLKLVADNAILLNISYSLENISDSIKIKTENGFYLKQNVCIFRRNENRTGKQLNHRQLFESSFFQFFFVLKPSYEFGICCRSFSIFAIACSGFFLISSEIAVSNNFVSSTFLKFILL